MSEFDPPDISPDLYSATIDETDKDFALFCHELFYQESDEIAGKATNGISYYFRGA